MCGLDAAGMRLLGMSTGCWEFGQHHATKGNPLLRTIIALEDFSLFE